MLLLQRSLDANSIRIKEEIEIEAKQGFTFVSLPTARESSCLSKGMKFDALVSGE